MKKLITTLMVLIAVVLSVSAQVSWDQIKHSTTETPLADTAYFSILCRGGAYEALCQREADSITGGPNPGVTVLNVGDSVLWRLERGANFGTMPRIRFVNVKTGQYLYMGKKGGDALRMYMGPREDPFGGTKDFVVYDRGPRVPAEYYYGIADPVTGTLVGNTSAGVIGVAGSDKSADAKYMWRFNKKIGPQPKPAAKPVPEIGLSTVETTFASGGNVTLNAKVTKGAADLTGNAIIFHGATLLDTLELNASGEGTITFEGLQYGIEKFALVYTNDAAYEPVDSIISLNVGPSANAKAVTLTLTPDAMTKEVHSEVNFNINVADIDSNPIGVGKVYLTVNGNVKNSFVPDVLGQGSVTLPNLLVGNDTIAAYYVGDKNNYLDSDTMKVIIEITHSTADIKPYPVYFDLGSMFEVQEYLRKYSAAHPNRGFSVVMAADSMHTISLSTDTAVTKTYYNTYNANALSYTSSDVKDLHSGADRFTIPFGVSPRPTTLKIKTPWLNKGAYNIYLNQRLNSGTGVYPSVALNEKELYYPSEELARRAFKQWASNNHRRWNAQGHSNNLPMQYFGTGLVTENGVQELEFTAVEGGTNDVWLDMIQFIPVDQDSLKITEKAAVGLAKTYYPLFDLGAFARFEGDTAVKSFSGIGEMAVPYQVADPSNYTKYAGKVESLGITPVPVADDEMFGNYIVIYKAEDKWTRVAEGYISENNDFDYELPAADYYYQELFYYAPIPDFTKYNSRLLIKDGTFTVEAPNQVIDPATSKIKAFSLNGALVVRGIEAGASILVTDLSGRIIANKKSQSTSFTQTLPTGAYLVKVISEGEILRTKVIVK